MTELEWLKQESGFTDDELKAMEAVAGHTKFVAMLQKLIASNENATKEKADAEAARLALEKRYQDEMIPELRRTATDAIRAQGEVAALRAKLAKAQEYGIVPDDPAPTVTEPPRAPGSPDPNLITRDDFGRFENNQANTIIAVQDLSADHFKLFGEPLGGVQDLVSEVNRQRTLGNKAFTLKNAWETKHNVEAKRKEISEAAQKKHDDEIRAAVIKEEREKNGANPNLRRGQTSRFSTYKSTESPNAKEPWKMPGTVRSKSRNNEWRQKAVAKVREFAAT